MPAFNLDENDSIVTCANVNLSATLPQVRKWERAHKYLARSFERSDGLVVAGVPEALSVDGQDGVPDVELPGEIGGHALEDLGDDDRHLVLPAALETRHSTAFSCRNVDVSENDEGCEGK